VFKGDPTAARIAMQGILDEVREAFSEAESARAAALPS